MPSIDLAIVPDDNNTEAVQQLLATLVDTEVKTWILPVEVSGQVLMPFVRDERGRKHFGIEGIQTFVQQRQQV